MPHKTLEARRAYLQRPEVRERSRARKRRWRENHRAEDSQHSRDYYARNKEKSKARKRTYYVANRRKVIESVTRYQQANLQQRRDAQRRRRQDPRRRIRMTLCVRIHRAIKKSRYGIKTMTMLGCSLKDFFIYLESKFEPGMTWENYGKVWHVDHIMPCAIFDLTKPEHQRRCFHFSNLQPLFGSDNLRKGAKVTTDQFNLL